MRPFLMAVVLLCSAGIASAALPADVHGQPLPTLAPMLERTLPSVVNISTTASVVETVSPLFDDPFFRRFFEMPRQQRERQQQGLGSGVIIDAEQGYILTNNHVIERADSIVVTLEDRRRFNARVIGADRESDIALLQIEADGLRAIPFADSDQLRVGDFVVAIGNPFGLGQTVTSGIVSALGRSGLGLDGFEDFIQTDASINPGNSGGALVNLRGELIGINTAILARGGGNIGIGFAIPINMALRVQQHLAADGVVTRGRLGIGIQDLTPELAQAFSLGVTQGAVVTRVELNSSAERAGLFPGDLVLEVNGRSIRSATDLRNQLGLLRLGSEVELRILRNGQPMALRARIEAIQPAELEGAELDQRLSGIRFELHRMRNGQSQVRVSEVRQGTMGARSGLRTGDVVLGVNRREVSSLDELRQWLQGGRGNILLNVQRGNSVFLLLLQ